VTASKGTDVAGTIVCGVTDSAEGRAAAQLAGALCERLEARLVLVHAIETAPRGADAGPHARCRREAAERTLELIASATAVPRGTELRVQYGDRAAELARVAFEEGADLIVLGSRGRGWRGRRLGSALARELEATTPAPVLVAPPQTRTRSDRRLSVPQSSAAG